MFHGIGIQRPWYFVLGLIMAWFAFTLLLWHLVVATAWVNGLVFNDQSLVLRNLGAMLVLAFFANREILISTRIKGWKKPSR